MRSSATCCAAPPGSGSIRRCYAPPTAICRCTKTGWRPSGRLKPSPAPRKRVSLARIHDGAQHDSAFLGRVVAGAAVHRRPLVPDQQVANLPGMVVDEAVLRRMFGEVLDQRPGLLALHADKPVRV